MTIGAVVWTVIGAAWLAAVVGTRMVRSAPGIESVVRAFLSSWSGRLVALGVWAEAGWHLFGQRP